MRILAFILTTCIFITGTEAEARELEDSPGLSPILSTASHSESIFEGRFTGEINSFINEKSRENSSCGSCGAQ